MTITLPDTDAVDEDGYVPVISLAGLDDRTRRAEVAGQLGDALRRSGFYVAVDHLVPLPVFERLNGRRWSSSTGRRRRRPASGPSLQDAPPGAASPRATGPPAGSACTPTRTRPRPGR